MVADRTHITINITDEITYLLSNGTIMYVVHRDLDLHFQGPQFCNANFSEAAKSSAKMRDKVRYFFVEWPHCRSGNA